MKMISDLDISDKVSPNLHKLNTLDDQSNKSEKSPSPSRIIEGDYAALMETSDKECESWYYFIRCQGNEEALKHLQNQLEEVEWYITDDISTFDLDLDHFVSAKTAKEMTKLELNSYAFHRKFDGKLKKINLNFKKKDKNEKKMCRTFDQLGYGQIEDFISDEDLDSEDLTDNNESDTDDDSTDSESSTEEDVKKGKGSSKKEVSKEDDSKKTNKKEIAERPKGIPPALLKSDRPNWAKAKGKKYQNH